MVQLTGFLTALAITTVDLVRADLSIFCSTTALPDLPAQIRSFEQYEQCDSTCQCSAFELLCVQRVGFDGVGNLIFTLESSNYDSVQACASENSCICNYQPAEIWSQTAMINGGVSLPAPTRVDLPSYDVLKARAELNSFTREYERDLFNELSSTAVSRPDHIVIHPLNEAFYGELPDFKVSTDVASIDANCDGAITCDLYYELDWSVRLRQVMRCTEVVALEPCFATNACVCDTGYFRIAETMPAPPTADEEKADNQVIDIDLNKLAEAEQALAEQQAGENNGSDTPADNEETSQGDQANESEVGAEENEGSDTQPSKSQEVSKPEENQTKDDGTKQTETADGEEVDQEVQTEQTEESSSETAEASDQNVVSLNDFLPEAEQNPENDNQTVVIVPSTQPEESSDQSQQSEAGEGTEDGAEPTAASSDQSFSGETVTTTPVDNSNSEEEDFHLETWHLVAAGCAAVIVMMFIGACIFYSVKACRRSKSSQVNRVVSSAKQSNKPKIDASVKGQALTNKKQMPGKKQGGAKHVSFPPNVDAGFQKDEEAGGGGIDQGQYETDRVEILNTDHCLNPKESVQLRGPNFAE